MNLNEFLNKNVVGNNDYLKKKVNSEQFELAGRIMELESKQGLTQVETARFLGIDYEKLLDFESGDIEIPVNEYKRLIQKFENLCGLYQINNDNYINNNYTEDDNLEISARLDEAFTLFSKTYELNGRKA